MGATPIPLALFGKLRCKEYYLRALPRNGSVDPTRAELAFLIKPVDEDEKVRWILFDLALGDELEDELVLTIARSPLNIGDLVWSEQEFTYQMLPPEHLDHKSLRLLLGKVPMQILVVVQNRLRGAGSQDAIGVTHEPCPEHIEGKGRSVVHQSSPVHGNTIETAGMINIKRMRISSLDRTAPIQVPP